MRQDFKPGRLQSIAWPLLVALLTSCVVFKDTEFRGTDVTDLVEPDDEPDRDNADGDAEPTDVADLEDSPDDLDVETETDDLPDADDPTNGDGDLDLLDPSDASDTACFPELGCVTVEVPNGSFELGATGNAADWTEEQYAPSDFSGEGDVDLIGAPGCGQPAAGAVGFERTAARTTAASFTGSAAMELQAAVDCGSGGDRRLRWRAAARQAVMIPAQGPQSIPLLGSNGRRDDLRLADP